MTAQTPDAFVFKIRLMAREATTRLADATVLSSTVAANSDSAYLLSLLAFELLLKACILINGATPGRSHSYSMLYALLPTEVQKRLLETACTRMTTDADFADLETLLDTWSRNFVDLRYPYERYNGLTEEKYRARGDAWLASGAYENEADFVYHPNELQGLTYALQVDVEAWLSSRSQ